MTTASEHEAATAAALPRSNMWDRVVGYFSPQRAVLRSLARQQFQALGGYDGADMSRPSFLSWVVPQGDAATDTLPSLRQLRQNTRHLSRNAALAAGAVNRVTTMTVGEGLRVRPTIDAEALGLSDDDAEAWETRAAAEFGLWAESRACDATLVQTFAEQQDLVFRSTLESGDVFAVRRHLPGRGSPYATAYQIFEADQVETPHNQVDGRHPPNEPDSPNRLYGGVETDPNGAHLGYWFRRDHPGAQPQPQPIGWTRVAARGRASREPLVLHCFDRRRPGQPRGIPYLAPVIEQLQQLSTYSQAELYAAVIGAMITVLHKTAGGTKLAPLNPADRRASTASGDQITTLRPGLVADIRHADDVQVPNLGRPNPNFDPFFVAIVRQIGSALEIPFELLIIHFTASYSASKGAIEVAWAFIRGRRAFLRRRYCQPAYDAVIAEAIALGRLEAPGFEDPLLRRAWLGTDWTGPSRIALEPKREAEADKINQDEGWKTRSEITSEKTGGDFERKIRIRRREKRLTEAAGLAPPPPPPGGQPPGAQPPESPPPEDDPDEPEKD